MQHGAVGPGGRTVEPLLLLVAAGVPRCGQPWALAPGAAEGGQAKPGEIGPSSGGAPRTWRRTF